MTKNCYANEPVYFSSILVPALDQLLNEHIDVNQKGNQHQQQQHQQQRKRAHVPPVDIIESPGHYTVKMDLPGVAKECLAVHFDESSDLVISVNPVDSTKPEEVKYALRERPVLTTSERKIKLSKDVDQDSVEAKLIDGVLTIKVARHVPQKKTISIE